MCIALTALSTIASIAGTAISAYGAYKQGQDAQTMAEYNAKVAMVDAQNKESAAIDASRRGQIAEDQQRSKVRQALASQRVAFAAGGDELTDSSTVDVFGDTAATGELDALTIRSNAAREAWGIRNSAANSVAQAQGYKTQGQMAASSGVSSAIGTVIGGASNIYRSNLSIR